MIMQYESIAALRADYIRLGCRGRDIHGVGDSWYNNETEEETLRKTELGDTSLVPLAEEAITKLDAAVETPRREWTRSPAGPFCVVPDVLAGLPTPMRRSVETRDEHSVITLLADVGSSAVVSSEMLRKRGVAILALVLALTRARPVMLYQLDVASGNHEGESVLLTPINTHPLDLATACYVLTSAGFSRRIVMKVEEKRNGHSGGWPRGFDYAGDSGKYYTNLKRRLGLDPAKTLVIPAAKANDELIVNPIPWLNKQIARFTTEQEEVV